MLYVNLQDVVDAGTVKKAIEAVARRKDGYASGVVGPEFSTSGSKVHGVSDFAIRSFEGGATHYVDSSDGTVAIYTPVFKNKDGEYSDHLGKVYDESEVLTDLGGDKIANSVTWSDHSIVNLVCPSVEAACENPVETGLMLDKIEEHSHYTEKEEWVSLILKVETLAEELRSIKS